MDVMSFILQNGNFKILVRTSCEQKIFKTKNKTLYQVTVTNLNTPLPTPTQYFLNIVGGFQRGLAILFSYLLHQNKNVFIF